MTAAHESIKKPNTLKEKCIQQCLCKHGRGKGLRALLTFSDKGDEGVNNCNKSPCVILEQPQSE